ncbi:MAG TPA: response regulator [Dongiaceae bacterium]|nr:response regulator [Dongiaceae bacterium]
MNTSNNATPSSVADITDGLAFKTILTRHVVVPLGFGLTTILFFIAIIYYLQAVSRTVDHSEMIIRDSSQLLQLLIDHETAMRGFVITKQEDFLDPFNRAERHVKPTIEKIKSELVGKGAQYALMESVYDNYEQWRRYASTVIDATRNDGNTDELVSTRQGKRLMDEMRQMIADFAEEEQRIKSERRSQSQMLVFVLVAGYFLISLLFSALMAFGGRRQLYALSNAYGDLLSRQKEQTDRLEFDAWLYAGESGVASCIISQSTPAGLAQCVLGFLGDYVGCRVGAVYVADSQDTFTRIADFGLSREMAQRDSVIAAGEGLIWRAASERHALYLDDIESNYFKVSSGLGDTAPASLVLLPLLEEGNAIAVLELGFTRKLMTRDHKLFERIIDSLGTAFAATRYRQRLRTMLVDVQQLNHELQTQQEELRTANEELEEQSQLLEESQVRLETQRSELEAANQTLMNQRKTLHSRNEALMKAQQQLEEHAAELERASRHKSEFIANMSHELRTPLNSQLILSQLLAENAEGNLTPEQVRSAKAVHSAGKDLLVLINDVLDIAKVEVGKLEVKPETVRTAQLLDTLGDNFRDLAYDKQLEFDVISAPDAPDELFTDRRRLEQILRNLLTNAIKFTEHGYVHLIVAGVSPGRVRFTVSDTGIGISEADQDAIFDAFHQVDSSNGRKYSGTGLGLSIARQLAVLLGGDISVISEPNSGSQFILDIPVEMTVRAEPVLPLARPLPVVRPVTTLPLAAVSRVPQLNFEDDRFSLKANQKTILVAEDEVEFARILYNLAHEMGYQCLVATSAEDAIALANQHDLRAALLDMKLPDHSGLTVLAHFKSRSRLRHVPVHVISVEDRSEAAMQMGAIGYLTKPATREQLRDVFVGIEHRLAQQMKKVLVAEPAGKNAHSVAALIADADIQIITVNTADQALDQLRSNTFDCIIVDYDQPDIDCEALLQRMSSADPGSFPPVVVYASRHLSPEEEAGLQHHSKSIVVKGARSPERLLDEVMLFLHKCETKLSSEQQDLLQAARAPNHALDGHRILLVDDDVRNVYALTSALESRGAEVEIARNGLEAVKKVNEVPHIDLVLMDIMMPEMDGYQAMAEIRKNPDFKKLSIIAVTAKATQKDQERCLRAGANDYVAKPVDVDRLLSLIQVWLPKVRLA